VGMGGRVRNPLRGLKSPVKRCGAEHDRSGGVHPRQ
jgi:hypothetical protein